MAIRPSAAATLERCPYRFYREYIARDAHGTSRAAVTGTVYHEIASTALKYRREMGQRPSTATLRLWLGQVQLGTLTATEARDLLPLIDNYHEPEDLQEIVAIEPTMTSGDAAEPAPEWMPVRLWNGFEVWGTPDLIYRNQAGTLVIHDWKTGRKPEDPSGWAPIVYARLLAEHSEALGCGELVWPVRIQWHFVRYGWDGIRSGLVYPEDVDNELERLEGLLRQARRMMADPAGRFFRGAAQANEYCAFCPVMGECPLQAWCGAKTLAEQYVWHTAEERAAADRAARVREQLVPIIAEDADRDAQAPFFVSERMTYRGQSLGKTRRLQDLIDVVRRNGGNIEDCLSVTAPKDEALREALAEAGFLKKTMELDVRRRRTLFEEAGIPEPRPSAEVTA